MDRTRGSRPALIVGCLFVLVVASTQRWRAQSPDRFQSAPTVHRTIAMLPYRVGAEIRAQDVLRELAAAEKPSDESTTALRDISSVGQSARAEAAILSRVKNAERPQVTPEAFPEFDLLKDRAYQRSRAQALSDRAASPLDLPAVRSPALTKIFHELHMREMQKRQAKITSPSGPTVGPQQPAKTAKSPGINLTAQPALGPPAGALSWPEAKRLSLELGELEDPLCKLWAAQVQSGVDALRSVQSIFDPATKQALAELASLRQDAKRLAGRVHDPEDKSKLLIAAYGLQRRTYLWSAVARAAHPAVSKRASQIAGAIDRREMLARIEDVKRMLKGTPHENAWMDYLALEALEAVAISPSVHRVSERTPIAHKILLRCNIHFATEKQREILTSPPVVNLDRELRRWVTQPVDLQPLIHSIEAFELTSFQRHSDAITQSWNRLRWSRVPEYKVVAEAIDLHYRNANVRVSVTEEFMNRMIPAMQNVKSPVREHIMGAQVRGLSTSNMKLNIDLMDDAESVRLQLQADGRLAANTQSTKGAVTLHSLNRSNFVIEKLFVLNRHGVQPGPARAAASGDSSVIGLQTRYDTFPLIGAMVRRVARQKAFETRPLQRRIFEYRVAATARKNIDAKVDRQLDITNKHISERFIGPLTEMELDPMTISLSSSEDRALYRGRLAGSHQLAAFTARPRASANNYLNMQVHISAVNNFLRQLDLDGQRGSIRDVMKSVIGQMGFPQVTIPDEVPDGVTIALAKRDSVRIECDKDRVSFTLCIAELKLENRTWRKFAVRAHYAPTIDGLHCELQRVGTVELQGRRASKDLALRAIFVKVFSKNRPIPLVHPELVKDRRMQDLQIDQFIVRDGWIGISVGQRPEVRTAAQIAHRPTGTHR
jgi:hypothetical protein